MNEFINFHDTTAHRLRLWWVYLSSGRRSRHMRDQSCCRQYLRNLASDEPPERPASVNERVIDKKYLRAAFMRFGQQLDGLKIWHKFYTWDRVLARGEYANLQARPDISTCSGYNPTRWPFKSAVQRPEEPLQDKETKSSTWQYRSRISSNNARRQLPPV